MTTYKEIFGKPIKVLSSDPTDAEAEGQVWYNTTSGTFKTVLSVGAWSSASPLSTAREKSSGFGTQAAATVAGGNTPPQTNATEEYNGSGWATGGNLNTPRQSSGGAGTQSAGLAYGGYNGSSPYLADSEEYNGTSWSEGNNLNTARYITGSGSQTAALGMGGATSTGGTSACEEYDGTNWTAGGSLNTARNYIAGFGIQTAAVAATGGPAGKADVEEYDGSSWTTVTSVSNAREIAMSSGVQTDGIVYGGRVDPGSVSMNKTEGYDGTSWTAQPTMATARFGSGANQSSGTASAAIAAGGNTNPPNTIVGITEEYNFSTNVITAAAWSSGGALNQARRIQGNVGGKDAGLSFGGFTSSPEYLNVSEEYDGTSWAEGNNLNTGRYGLRGFGIQTAAVAIGGQASPAPTAIANYESYDGSSWTASGNMNVAREEPGGFGILTAGVATGGFNGNPSTMLNSTEEYDGSSWTAGGATSVAAQSMASTGTLTAGAIAGGYLGPPGARTNRTEEYGGTNWTSGPNVFIEVSNSAPAKNGTQNAWQFAGGRAPGIISTTCVYDGSSWATGPNIATARTEFDGGGASSGAGAHLICGGQPGSSSAGVTTTEEFTGETTALNIKTLTSS